MFKEVKGDITKVKADVIINAADTQLQHGGGVARAIAQAAGRELVKESAASGYVPIGEVAVTTAGQLPAQKVFHIPTICYQKNHRATLADIKKALSKALKKAQEMSYQTIATPLLGAGVVGLEAEKVRKAIQEVAEKFPQLNVLVVIRR